MSHMNYPKFSSILWNVKITCLKEDKQIIELSDFLYFINLKWDYLWNIIVWRLHMLSIQKLVYVKIYISIYTKTLCKSHMYIHHANLLPFGSQINSFRPVVCSPASSPFPSLAACKANGSTLDIRGMSRASAQAKPGWSFKTSTAIRGPPGTWMRVMFWGKNRDFFHEKNRVNMEMTIVWCLKKLAMMNILILNIIIMTQKPGYQDDYSE